MKRVVNRFILLTIAILFLFSSACVLVDNEPDPSPSQSPSGLPYFAQFAPDYSESDLQMKSWAYIPPRLDVLNELDHRTEDNYRDYAEAGLNIMYIQYNPDREGYTTYSKTPEELFGYMDMAVSNGVEKIVVYDGRLYDMSASHTSLVGTAAYPTQADLNAYVADCMKDYKDHPAFYGSFLIDEPSYGQFTAIGQVYKAIKAAAPDADICVNLFPMFDFIKSAYAAGSASLTTEQAYRSYLNNFLEKTGADYIMLDSYPFMGTFIQPYHFRTLQIAAEVCKEKGVELRAFAQSFSKKNSNGDVDERLCDETDMYWQLNFYLGMGVKEIAYFTYYQIAGVRPNGSVYIDNSTFMTVDGQKTPLYHFTKKINAEIREFAPILLNFEYQGLNYYKGSGVANINYVKDVARDDFTGLKSVLIDDYDFALVTELYDAQKENYMYMVQNIHDPKNIAYQQNAEITLEFGEEYNYAVVYYKDSVKYVELKDGKYTATLSVGQAEYILPY